MQIREHVQRRKAEIDPRHVFHFNRDEEKQQHLCLRRDGRHGKKQTEVQRGRVSSGAQQQRGQIGQHKACEIIKVEAERAPVAFQDFAELIIAEQRNGSQKQPNSADVI